MSNFFSIESPFYRFMIRLTDMLKLNVLWLLTSGVLLMFLLQILISGLGFGEFYILSFVPLLTLGAATTAVFNITLRMVDEEEGYITKAYFRAFRENFKKGNIIGWIFIFALYAIWLDFQFYNAAEKVNQSSTVYLIIGILAVVMAFSHLIYAFPIQARYENKIINILRNSFSISVRYFGKTLLLFIVAAVVVGFFMWNSVTQFLGILIGPATLMLAISGTASQIFHLIENDNAERKENGEE